MNASADAFAAVEAGDLERLRQLVTAEPGITSARDPNGVSILLQARYRFRLDMVDVLLAAAPELDVFEAAALGETGRLTALLETDESALRAFSADGFSPLHLAAFFAQPAAVTLLLDRGADARAVARNGSDLTPLNSAAASRSTGIVAQLLRAGAEVDARQAGGWTALMAAAKHGLPDMVDALLAAGADPALTVEGKTAADLAAEAGHEAVAERLRAR